MYTCKQCILFFIISQCKVSSNNAHLVCVLFMEATKPHTDRFLAAESWYVSIPMIIKLLSCRIIVNHTKVKLISQILLQTKCWRKYWKPFHIMVDFSKKCMLYDFGGSFSKGFNKSFCLHICLRSIHPKYILVWDTCFQRFPGYSYIG